jgi:hypothetical protein
MKFKSTWTVIHIFFNICILEEAINNKYPNKMSNYTEVTGEIAGLIRLWEPRLSSLPNELLSHRRNSQNRSVKQILGHLIDSTSNNIHRMVHLQYQASPLIFPNYASLGNNDKWIAIQDYQNEEWSDMIQLWKYLLLHFCHVVKNVNPGKLENEWIAGPEIQIPLSSMIPDFLSHLKLHLVEINELIDSI